MKTCLIGVDGLLGREWIEALKNLNHHIIGLGPSPSPQSKLANLIDKYHALDLSSSSDDDLEAIFSNERPINIIFNAGVDAKPGSGQEALTSYPLESWKEIFEINVFGLVKVLNAAATNQFRPKNVIVIGSMYSEKSPNPSLYSHYGEKGLTKHPAYSSSKHAALGIVKQYASHYAAQGMVINMLSPGAVHSGQDELFVEKISEKIPMKRLVSPSELQSILKFLLEENTYATGQNFVLDGGMNLW